MAEPSSRLARLRQLARYAGWSVVAASLAFIGYRIIAVSGPLVERGLSVTAVASIIMGAAGYALLVGLMALGLRELLTLTSGWSVPHMAAIDIYGRSNVLKYLPGNIMHFAGRQVLGGRHRLPQASIAAATSFEILLTVAAAVLLIAALGAHPLAAQLTAVPLETIGIAVALLLVLGTVGLRIVARHPRFAALDGLTLPRLGRHGLVALLVYLAFHAGMGALVWVTGNAAGLPCPAMDTFMAVITLAWLVGFVVPGASAGMGVREAMLTLLLQGSMGEEGALALALAMRMVTVFGDLLALALAIVAVRRWLPAENVEVPA